MTDDTRRAMSILAKAVFKLRSDEDLDEAHATELRALAWPPQPPAPQTVDVLGSDLRVGDVVEAKRFADGSEDRAKPFRVQRPDNSGAAITYRVRLPRPEVAPSGPADDDPEWRDVPAERAAFKTLRVGDRWFTSSNRWITTNGLAVDPTGYQWIKRHDHPSRKRAPSVAVDAPADALLPSWVDVEALAREEHAAWTKGLTSWQSLSSELRQAWCTTARTVATAVLRMQRDAGIRAVPMLPVNEADERMVDELFAARERTGERRPPAQQTSAGALAKASPSTARGADGPRTFTDGLTADMLGRHVRDVWIEWARAQPDVGEHPSWLVPWDEIPERDRVVDRRIGVRISDVVLKDWSERHPVVPTQPETAGEIARCESGNILAVKARGQWHMDFAQPASTLASHINAAHRAAVASLVAERDAARETIAAALRLCFDLEGACRRPGSQSEAHALDVIARIRAELKGGE